MWQREREWLWRQSVEGEVWELVVMEKATMFDRDRATRNTECCYCSGL